MGRDNQSSGQDASGAAAAPALHQATFEKRLAQTITPEQCCAELSKIFRVRSNEVALLRLEHGLLKFLFPEELTTAGSIPISSSSAVAAHTAVTAKVELFNNFTKVKHASVFETIKPGAQKDEALQPATIHKLMSGPVLDKAGKVVGVLQICHKGFDLASAGPDFTLDDLGLLERAAAAVAQVGFMRSSG